MNMNILQQALADMEARSAVDAQNLQVNWEDLALYKHRALKQSSLNYSLNYSLATPSSADTFSLRCRAYTRSGISLRSVPMRRKRSSRNDSASCKTFTAPCDRWRMSLLVAWNSWTQNKKK